MFPQARREYVFQARQIRYGETSTGLAAGRRPSAALAAIGAEHELRLQLPAATAAAARRLSTVGLGRGGGPARPAAPSHHPAAAALQELIAPLHPEQGYEEQAEVMIQAHPPGRGQTAGRAGARSLLQHHLLGLYAADEEKEGPPPRGCRRPCRGPSSPAIFPLPRPKSSPLTGSRKRGPAWGPLFRQQAVKVFF